MLTTRERSQSLEVLKWLAVIALVVMLATVLTKQASGKEATQEGPKSLPMAIDDWAQPMSGQYPDAESASEEPNEQFNLTMRLWHVLDMHRAGDVGSAAATWEGIELPPETAVWRHVAIASCKLMQMETEEATKELDAAMRLDSANPLVHYYFGILWLREAANAHDWYDAAGPVQFASHGLPRVVPNTRSMYKLAATMEFMRAIELASNVGSNDPLVPDAWGMPSEYSMTMPVIAPTVGELLEAMHMDDFEGKAHLWLGALGMDADRLESAESHLDQAVGLGQRDVGFRKLGAKYEAAGRFDDAARAYLKAVESDGGKVVPLKKAIENIGKALLRS